MSEITGKEAAELAGVSPSTFRSYVARGQAPAPKKHVGTTPVWDERKIRAWVESRPGRGSRSTPRAKARAKQRAQESS